MMVLFAAFGWWMVNDPKAPLGLSDIFYRAFKAITLSDAYDTVGSKNGFLEAARWIGLVLFSGAAAGLIGRVFKEEWLSFKPNIRSNHLLVIGDTPLAHAIAQQARSQHVKAIHLYKDGELSEEGSLISVPFTSSLWRKSLSGAKSVVIALDEDAQGVSLATETSFLAKKSAPKAEIMVRLSDSWLKQSIHRLDGLEYTRSFSDRALAAREILRRHPLFILAEDLGQDKITVRLRGDDEFVEALLLEMLLSSLTMRFGVPKAYIDVPDEASFEARLTARYPELSKSVELVFAEPAKDAALTATYVAYDEPTRSLSEAMWLREQAIRQAGSTAPIFVQMIDQSPHRLVSGQKLPDYALEHFGANNDIIKALEVFSPQTNLTAIAFHQSYLKTLRVLFPDANADEKPANLQWDRLSEQFRSANRWIAAHLPAKLFDAGFDIRPWLKTDKQWSALPSLAEPLYRDEAELSRLAEAEHIRWNADRRIMGWVYGPKRDNQRLIHPNLVDYAALEDSSKAFDLGMIKHINETLPKSKKGLKRG